MRELVKNIYGRWWSFSNGQWLDPFTGKRFTTSKEFRNYIADVYGQKEADYFWNHRHEYLNIDWHLQFPAYLEALQKRAKSKDKVPQEGNTS